VAGIHLPERDRDRPLLITDGLVFLSAPLYKSLHTPAKWLAAGCKTCRGCRCVTGCNRRVWTEVESCSESRPPVCPPFAFPTTDHNHLERALLFPQPLGKPGPLTPARVSHSSHTSTTTKKKKTIIVQQTFRRQASVRRCLILTTFTPLNPPLLLPLQPPLQNTAIGLAT